VQIEVYKQTKPPLHSRPIVVSSLLMICVGALATQMSLSRAADPLGRTLLLPDLNCSIRPPRGFVRHTGLAGGDWRIQPFEAITTPWGHAKLAVWYTRSEHTPSIESMAQTIFMELGVGSMASEHTEGLRKNNHVLIGTADAYEIQDTLDGLVVRVRELPGRGYLAISVSADAPIDHWLEAFDATCRSVQIAP